ncbi:hypothetical protein HYS47_04400 [Candidatus Woesearchaeota archaeon]|nr:hypothetical protein [Candidatus Woesearchaeota archaeon]
METMNLRIFGKQLNTLQATILEVFHSPLSLGIFIFSFFFVIVFNIGIINYRFYFSKPGWNEAIAVFIGTFSAILPQEVLVLVVIAILTGMVAAFLTYYFRRIQRNSRVETAATTSGGSSIQGGSISAGSLGALLGIAAPACPACGIGLFSLLGYSGLLAVLPFRGKELGVIGIILLLFSIVSISNKINGRTCQVKRV